MEDHKQSYDSNNHIGAIKDRVLIVETTVGFHQKEIHGLKESMNKLEQKVDDMNTTIHAKIDNVEHRLSEHLQNNHQELMGALSTHAKEDTIRQTEIRAKVNKITTTLNIGWAVVISIMLGAGWMMEKMGAFTYIAERLFQ